ncbi:hypothetical protein CONCODRAFT_2277 [Conidiobolus coronatus NRRL 28638]|uniref:BTB domain-containing protein n=1 Tax=Conidiobolus coronatus (strain ATCC 28846 / CBS 209.66 / NRRL 28638) TaxID=796925 RepID=A0A137PI88_CONC2|nr:hypothetical protein CONCODRAFT_2277 [Conidiobolus coronatus NRRL 28638]|eukprot:KXN74714.1 hypothetical protein CONCODRAFT_2277 [Conidiobolus coronatus NRRL 28638]
MQLVDSLLFSACEIGDLRTIKCLVLHFNVSITQGDKKYLFPIYYACKYGHIDVVKFLISAGGADIGMSNIIKCYLVSCPSIKSLLVDLNCNDQHYPSPFINHFNLYYLEIRNSHHDNVVSFLIFEKKGDTCEIARVQAHSVILEARCPEFYTSNCRFGNREVSLYSFNEFRPTHFSMIIKYLYYGTLFIPQRSMKKFLIRVCSYLQLNKLKHELRSSNSFNLSKPERISDYCIDFQRNYINYFQLEIVEKIINLNEVNLLHFCYQTESKYVNTINKVLFVYPYSTVDCLLNVEDYLIPCHQMILRLQSPYFKQLLTSDFYEAIINKHCLKNGRLLPIFTIDNFSFDAILDIIKFLYTGNCDLEYEKLIEILKACDYYLIEDLKELICAKMSLPLIDTSHFTRR